MAKANVAADTAEAPDTGDAPLIDLNDASVKKVIARAKKRGYITYDQLNEALPQGEMSSDQIEDMTSALSEMGINIVENDEAGEDGETEERADDGDEVETVDGRFRCRAGRGEEEGNGRSHRRSRSHVPARNGRG